VLVPPAAPNVPPYYTVPRGHQPAGLAPRGDLEGLYYPAIEQRQHTATADRRIGMMLTLAATLLTIIPIIVYAARYFAYGWSPPMWGAGHRTADSSDRLLLLVNCIRSVHRPTSPRSFEDNAFIHVGQVIPYLAALIFMTYKYGILGTALVWTARPSSTTF